MISILIPVLARPDNAAKVVDSIRWTTENDYGIIFVCSPADYAEIAAVEDTNEEFIVCGWTPGPGDFARKTNLGFRLTEGEWVFLGADDLVFHEGWDAAALEVAAETGAAVIGTQDLCNPLVKRGRHSTHSLVHRDYIDSEGGTFDEEPGVVYAECYDHQSVDNELLIVAQDRGRWAFAERSVVEHLHPLTRRTSMDATYRKALANGREDYALFNSRRVVWNRNQKRRPART